MIFYLKNSLFLPGFAKKKNLQELEKRNLRLEKVLNQPLCAKLLKNEGTSMKSDVWKIDIDDKKERRGLDDARTRKNFNISIAL